MQRLQDASRQNNDRALAAHTKITWANIGGQQGAGKAHKTLTKHLQNSYTIFQNTFETLMKKTKTLTKLTKHLQDLLICYLNLR